MKAKELAEELLKYPDFDVQASVCVSLPTYDKPYEEYEYCELYGIDVEYERKNKKKRN